MSSNLSASSDGFVFFTIGHLANAIDLIVLVDPPVQAAPDLKACCYDFFSELLVEHASLFSSAELAATLGEHI